MTTVQSGTPPHNMRPPSTGERRYWYTRARSSEEARASIRLAARTCFFLGALFVPLSFFADWMLLVGCAAYVAIGLALRCFNSRIAASLLFAQGILCVVITVANLATGMAIGGVYSSLFLLWASLRAVDAAFQLHGVFARKAPTCVTNSSK